MSENVPIRASGSVNVLAQELHWPAMSAEPELPQSFAPLFGWQQGHHRCGLAVVGPPRFNGGFRFG